MEMYDGTPVDMVCKMSASHEIKGDPAKMAAVIIACVDGGEAPLRLRLGSDAWPLVTTTMRARLDAWKARKTSRIPRISIRTEWPQLRLLVAW